MLTKCFFCAFQKWIPWGNRAQAPSGSCGCVQLFINCFSNKKWCLKCLSECLIHSHKHFRYFSNCLTKQNYININQMLYWREFLEEYHNEIIWCFLSFSAFMEALTRVETLISWSAVLQYKILTQTYLARKITVDFLVALDWVNSNKIRKTLLNSGII